MIPMDIVEGKAVAPSTRALSCPRIGPSESMATPKKASPAHAATNTWFVL